MPACVANRTFGTSRNVLDFGVRGDGVTDDTAALQAVFTHAATDGVPVYIPAAPVHYRTTARLTVTDGVPMIYGDGPASLIRTEHADGTPLRLSSVSRCVVRGIALTCSLTQRNQASYGLHGLSCTDVLVDNVWVQGGVSAGILFQSSTRIVVRGCNVQDTYADGIHFTNGASDQGCVDCIVVGNTVAGTADDGIAFVNYGTGENQPEAPNQFRCRAIGNTVSSSSANGIAVHGGAECAIEGNSVFSTKGHGIIVDGEGVYEVRSPSRCIVANNTVRDAGALADSGSYHGIHVRALANPDHETDVVVTGNVVQNPRNIGVYWLAEKVTVSGNVVDMGSSVSVALQGGTTTAGTTPPEDSVVTGNRVYGLSASGVVVTCPTGTEANRVTVTGNTVVEPAGASHDGISVTRGNGVTIADNTIEDQGANARAAVLLSSCANVELGANNLLGNTTVTLSSCTGVRRAEFVVTATPTTTTTYRAGQVAVDTTNDRLCLFDGTGWRTVTLT